MLLLPAALQKGVGASVAYVTVKVEDHQPFLPLSKSRALLAPAVNWYRDTIARAFLSDRNPVFARNAEHAFRCAAFVVVLGLPFLIPQGHVRTFDFLVDHGYKSSAVKFFIINLQMTLGDTLASCLHGFRGAFMSLLMTWFMVFLFPEGVMPDSPAYVFYLGVGMGVLYVTLVLSLELGLSTKIFAITLFLDWWMAFLTPVAHEFHCPFTSRFNFWKDIGIQHMVIMAIGVSLAVLSTLVPYPVLALDEVRETSRELSEHMNVMWHWVAEHFSMRQRNTLQEDQVYRNLHRFKTLYSAIDSKVKAAWWESFACRRRLRARRKLVLLQSLLQDGYDHLFAVWSTCQAGEFSEAQHKVMQQVKQEVAMVIQSCEEVMGACLPCACEGALSDSEEIEILGLVEKARASEAALSRKVMEARRTARVTNAASVQSGAVIDPASGAAIASVHRHFDGTLLIAHTVVFHLCAYSRAVCKLGEGLAASRRNPEVLPVLEVRWLSLLADVFKGVFKSDNLNFTVRGMAQIFTAFAIGWFGYEGLIPPHDIGLATSATVMLHQFTGSAIAKNMGRLQGAVLGLMTGQLVRYFLDSCHWLPVAALGVMVFIWAFTTVYIKTAVAAPFGSVGSLAAIFGLTGMLAGHCRANSVYSLNKEGTYKSILQSVVTCGLILAVDTVFAPQRASIQAHAALVHVLDEVDKAVSSHFSKDAVHTVVNRGRILKALGEAGSSGNEAPSEPRLWRTAWRQKDFDEVLRFSYYLRNDVRGMESCMSKDIMAGGEKNEVLKALLATKAFPRIGAILRGKIAVVRSLCGIFVHETVSRFPLLDDPEVTRSTAAEEEEALKALVEEVKRMDLLTHPNPDSICLDALCQISVAVASVEAMFHDLHSIQHAVLRAC